MRHGIIGRNGWAHDAEHATRRLGIEVALALGVLRRRDREGRRELNGLHGAGRRALLDFSVGRVEKLRRRHPRRACAMVARPLHQPPRALLSRQSIALDVVGPQRHQR